MGEPVMARPALRDAIATDLQPVTPLATPLVRSALLLPLAVLLLLAAPTVFAERSLAALGWAWSWGASLLQAALGLALTAAALREAVPGRAWSPVSLALWVLAPVASVTSIAQGSWERSPVELAGSGWIVGGLCVAYALASALPATLLTAVLAVRAWPTRPAVTGWLAGLGAGLMADAGWRLFCHFSEPSHVLTAHLGSVIAAGAVGAVVTSCLHRGR
jgi:hypothetical protein